VHTSATHLHPSGLQHLGRLRTHVDPSCLAFELSEPHGPAQPHPFLTPVPDWTPLPSSSSSRLHRLGRLPPVVASPRQARLCK
jgi:hypothetical protein